GPWWSTRASRRPRRGSRPASGTWPWTPGERRRRRQPCPGQPSHLRVARAPAVPATSTSMTSISAEDVSPRFSDRFADEVTTSKLFRTISDYRRTYAAPGLPSRDPDPRRRTSHWGPEWPPIPWPQAFSRHLTTTH